MLFLCSADTHHWIWSRAGSNSIQFPWLLPLQSGNLAGVFHLCQHIVLFNRQLIPWRVNRINSTRFDVMLGSFKKQMKADCRIWRQNPQTSKPLYTSRGGARSQDYFYWKDYCIYTGSKNLWGNRLSVPDLTWIDPYHWKGGRLQSNFMTSKLGGDTGVNATLAFVPQKGNPISLVVTHWPTSLSQIRRILHEDFFVFHTSYDIQPIRRGLYNIPVIWTRLHQHSQFPWGSFNTWMECHMEMHIFETTNQCVIFNIASIFCVSYDKSFSRDQRTDLLKWMLQ